jgi:hypothetical protein
MLGDFVRSEGSSDGGSGSLMEMSVWVPHYPTVIEQSS